MALKPLTNDRPFLKMAFTGFAGDGKTLTAAIIAAGLHKMIGSKKPIAFFDTEKASKALKPFFDGHGIQVIVDADNRSLAALNQTIKDCIEGAADILIIDTITHVWEEFVNAYMRQKGRTRLEFQDWGILKPRWKNEFSTTFVQAPLHIIFTGRAGYEYGQEKNEETGKREIYKSGIKMKAETETAFEPDILVYMEKELDILGDNKTVYRTATILKDRTTLIDGMVLNKDGKKKGPDFQDFQPAIVALLDGKVVQGGDANVILDTFEEDDKKALIRYQKNNIMSEVDGYFALMGLGTSTSDKQVKGWTLKQVFNVASVDKLNDIAIEELQQNFTSFKKFAESYIHYMSDCKANKRSPNNEEIKVLMKEAKPTGSLMPLVTDAFNDNAVAEHEKKRRDVTISEIEATWSYMGLGTSAGDKKLKAWMLNRIFNANSLDKVRELSLEELEKGQEQLVNFAEQYMKATGNGSTVSEAEIEQMMNQAKGSPATAATPPTEPVTQP